jgi:hypothetical protein
LLEVIIDHHRVSKSPPLLHFALTEGESGKDMGLVITPSTQARLLHLPRWSVEENTHDILTAVDNLASTLYVDLKHKITIIVGRGDRGAVIVVKHLRPFKKSALIDMA